MKKTNLLIGVLIMLGTLLTNQTNAQTTLPAGTIQHPSLIGSTPTLIIGNGTDYLFGTEKMFPEITTKVQLFEIGADDNFSFNVVGAVYWVGEIKKAATAGTVDFGVYDFCGGAGDPYYLPPRAYRPQGWQDFAIETSPGQTKMSTNASYKKTISTNDITASNTLDNAMVVTFDSPVLIDKTTTCHSFLWENVYKFGIGIDFANIGGTEMGLFSTGWYEGAINTDGDTLELAWVMSNKDNLWTSVVQSLHQYVPGANPDMLVFPIIDMTDYTTNGKSTGIAGGSSVGIENIPFISGIKLDEAYPSPTSDKCQIGYEIEKDADVSISIYDMSGKKYFQMNEGHKQAGKHSISIDVSDLESGNYLYVLKSDNNYLSRKVSIVK